MDNVIIIRQNKESIRLKVDGYAQEVIEAALIKNKYTYYASFDKQDIKNMPTKSYAISNK